jgi:hypothetical protein
VEKTTVLQLVDELRTMTDAEQWLIVAAVALLVVAFTGFLGLAVVLVTRTVVSAARFVTRKIRGLAGRADSADLPGPSDRARAAAGQLWQGTVVLRAD